MSKYVTVTAEAEVNLSEFDTDDLIEELERRGNDYNTTGVDGDQARQMLELIYDLRRQGQDYQRILDDLIYYVIGRIS
jgi:hypothetical protein